MWEEILESVIDAVETQEALAGICGIKQPSVSYWLKHKKPIPAEHIHKICAATNSKFKPEDIRPDIFGKAA